MVCVFAYSNRISMFIILVGVERREKSVMYENKSELYIWEYFISIWNGYFVAVRSFFPISLHLPYDCVEWQRKPVSKHTIFIYFLSVGLAYSIFFISLSSLNLDKWMKHFVDVREDF